MQQLKTFLTYRALTQLNNPTHRERFLKSTQIAILTHTSVQLSHIMIIGCCRITFGCRFSWPPKFVCANKMTNISFAEHTSEVNDHSITFMDAPSRKHVFPFECFSRSCHIKAMVVFLFLSFHFYHYMYMDIWM